ncbi:MAG: hypothetical protein ACYDG4_13615 [Desulfuromonadaceae bacterium]
MISNQPVARRPPGKTDRAKPVNWGTPLGNKRGTMKFNLFKCIKYLCPTFAILLPIMAIYGALISPPNWTESSLSKYDYSFKIFIGFSSYSKSSGNEEYQTSSRCYILFPSLKTVEVTKHSHSNRNEEANFKETSEITIEESTFLTYYALLSYLGFLFGTWWYWIRAASKQTEKANT